MNGDRVDPKPVAKCSHSKNTGQNYIKDAFSIDIIEYTCLLATLHIGVHGHRRAPGGRLSLNFTVTVLSSATAQSSILRVIKLHSD